MILLKRINEQIDISKVAEEDNEIVGTTEDLMKMDKTFTQIKVVTITDMEHKPNGWNLPINQMTEEEWKDYFECRKKYDIKLSEQERKEISDEAFKYLHDKEKFIEISKKNPLFPGLAIAAKACHGLKKIKDYNLSWAKEVYPDEF